MQLADHTEFLRHLSRLCAGFDVPMTKAREEAYFAGLARSSLAQFARCVDVALAEDSDDESMPTPAKLRKLLRARSPMATTLGAPSGVERLCEYVLRHYAARLSPTQLRGPWTYTHVNGEVTGVTIAVDGEHPALRVLLADVHAQDFAA